MAGLLTKEKECEEHQCRITQLCLGKWRNYMVHDYNLGHFGVEKESRNYLPKIMFRESQNSGAGRHFIGDQIQIILFNRWWVHGNWNLNG